MGQYRVVLGLVFSFWISMGQNAWAADFGFEPRPTCTRSKESDPVVFENDFVRNITLDEMRVAFQTLYRSPKRLQHRAYYDPKSKLYVMEHQVSGGAWKRVFLQPRFVRSIIRHVEIALERRYADFVFIQDMGHAHFYYPEEDYNRVTAFPVHEMDRTYQLLVDHPDLKVLYHTAEQLKVTSEPRGAELLLDRDLQWRYYTRNVLGGTQGGNDVAPLFAWANAKANTLQELPGHAEWNAGFNISASHHGCFPYQHNGQTYYFDLSLYDLPSNSAGAYDSTLVVD